MKVIRCHDYETCSAQAAELIADRVRRKPDALVGFATGDTFKSVYARMIQDQKDGKIDYRGIRTVNLDEYVGLPPTHDQSYRYFMDTQLFNELGLDPSRIEFASGMADSEVELPRLHKFFAQNRVDLQLLGVGVNGHMGFNEPDTCLHASFYKAKLTDSTITANSRLFNSRDEVPRFALTMGMGEIMMAHELLFMAFGESKADAVRQLLADDKVTVDCPCTFLKMHPNVTVFVDDAACKAL